jgi:hypothetical protein
LRGNEDETTVLYFDPFVDSTVRGCFMKPTFVDKTYACYLDYCADTIEKEEHDEPNLAEVQKYRPTATAYYETKLICGETEQQCLVTKTDIDTT